MGLANIWLISRNKLLDQISLTTNSKGTWKGYVTEEEPFKTYGKAVQNFWSRNHDDGVKTGRGERNEICVGIVSSTKYYGTALVNLSYPILSYPSTPGLCLQY